MAETTEYDWNEVDVDENISADQQKAAESITIGTPVGKFLITVVESKAVEKTFNAYTCVAASLKMRIDDVLAIEKKILVDGKPVTIQGQDQKKVLTVLEAEKTKYNKMYVGKFITDEINLANSSEKEGMRNRRIYVAKRFGLISQESEALTGKHWGKLIIGKQAIVITKWNRWKDKLTGELKENVKVDFSGYDYASSAKTEKKDYSGI